MRLILMVFVLLMTACSSSTVIETSDPDAKIYVNGEYVGTGHAHYSDSKVAFSKNEVVIRKEGCQADEHTFRRNEDADVGAILGGFLMTVPFLWITEYKSHRSYDYECVPEVISDNL